MHYSLHKNPLLDHILSLATYPDTRGISLIFFFFFTFSITSLQVKYYNSNQRMHSVLLKSQHYNAQTPTCIGLQWPINGEHAVVQESCLGFLHVAAKTSSLCSVCVCSRSSCALQTINFKM